MREHRGEFTEEVFVAKRFDLLTAVFATAVDDVARYLSRPTDGNRQQDVRDRFDRPRMRPEYESTIRMDRAIQSFRWLFLDDAPSMRKDRFSLADVADACDTEISKLRRKLRERFAGPAFDRLAEIATPRGATPTGWRPTETREALGELAGSTAAD